MALAEIPRDAVYFVIFFKPAVRDNACISRGFVLYCIWVGGYIPVMTIIRLEALIMARFKKIPAVAAALFVAFLFGGCYTRLMMYQDETLASGTGRSASSSAGGDCGDCRDVAPVAERREVCVWERDFLGFPELRCYTTNYHSSWIYFHNTPWWYRDRFGWRDTRGCPPYYYFDRASGICRYYATAGGGSGSGSSGTSGGPPPSPVNARVVQRPLREEVPDAESAPSGAPMFSGGSRQLSPVGSPAPSAPPASGQALSKPQDEAPQASAVQTPPQSQQPAQEQRQRSDSNQSHRPSARMVAPPSRPQRERAPQPAKGAADETQNERARGNK
jgi:hypothetical protein